MPLDHPETNDPAASVANLSFHKLVENMPTPYMVMDRSLTIVYANKAYLESVESTLPQLQGRYIFDCFADRADRISAVRETFLKTLDGVTTTLERQEFQLKHADGSSSTRCWQCIQTPYFDEAGRVIFIVQHSRDITEEENLRRRNEAISLELDHRVKNIYSVVQAVAALAGQNSTSLEDYRNDFEDRIIAMSRTHDALSRTDWDGLSLRQIFDEALAQFGGIGSKRIAYHGEDAKLNPRASQMASVLIHEFATNAAKYGCFSQPAGRLDVTVWPDRKRKTLKAEWKESGLSGIRPTDRKGFGTKLEEFLPNVKIVRDYEDDGLRIKISTGLLDKPRQ